MLTSKVIYTGDLRTEATHIRSGNKITTDAPVDNKGKGAYFSPTDLLATSLASCILTTMAIKAQSMNITLDGSYTDVEKIMGDAPRRVVGINIILYFTKGLSLSLSDKDKDLLEKVARHCPVHHSLHPDVKINVEFIYQ